MESRCLWHLVNPYVFFRVKTLPFGLFETIQVFAREYFRDLLEIRVENKVQKISDEPQPLSDRNRHQEPLEPPLEPEPKQPTCKNRPHKVENLADPRADIVTHSQMHLPKNIDIENDDHSGRAQHKEHSQIFQRASLILLSIRIPKQPIQQPNKSSITYQLPKKKAYRLNTERLSLSASSNNF